jgi:pimeloyl-ACP methyl ester carboxylesterase
MRAKRETGGLARKAAGAGLLAALGGIGYSTLFVPHSLPLPPAVSGGERRETEGQAGRLSYYVAGSGAPMLLIHSINAAGSAYEVKTIFEHYAASRRVYAVDLPGFGFSDRSDREYRMRLYVAAVHDMLDVIAEDSGMEPVDALALSLSSEFLARAALARPERFRSLALVTPTGFGQGSSALHGPPGSTREIRGMKAIVSFPLWGRPLFDALSSKASIRYFLEKTWGSKEIDEGMLEYDYLTTHQPGAQHAPYAFISGKLFSSDIRSVYEELTVPVWMPHGTRGDFGDFSEADAVAGKPNWTVQAFNTGALPHFEAPREFLDAYELFMMSLPRARAVVGA